MRASRLIWIPLVPFGLALAARRWLDVVEVRGVSMAPTLLPGDRVLVARLPARTQDVVLARDPRDPGRELVKRVARVTPSGLALRGDNDAASTDGRDFGPIPLDAVAWRAVLRYWPPSRIGRIPARPTPFLPVDEGGEAACTVPDALIAGS